MSNGNGKKNGGKPRTSVDEKPLTAKDLDLIEMLADPEDTRSKEDKCIAAGYSRKFVYALEKRPLFAARLSQRLNENFERIKQGRGQVLQALRERALAKNDVVIADANKAAELYLKVTGDIATGQNIHLTQVQTNEAETRKSREGRLGEHFTERGLPIVTE